MSFGFIDAAAVNATAISNGTEIIRLEVRNKES